MRKEYENNNQKDNIPFTGHEHVNHPHFLRWHDKSARGHNSGNKCLKSRKNLLSVELTIPASLIGDDAAILDEEAKAAGVSEITQNEDGSVTMKMSKVAHQKMLDEYKGGIDESIAEMLNDKETYPSFTEITYNEDLTEFTVKVDPATYGGLEALSAIGLYIAGNIYQALNAVPEDQIKTIVTFVNKDTGEIIETSDSSEMNETE